MTVGEKILCKRPLRGHYEKGKYYYISFISLEGYVYIPYNDDPADVFGYNTFHLRDNLIIKYDAQYFDNYQIFKFSDYFRTLKEERKQKLNKIKNGNI